MKLKRRKAGDGNYEIVDETGAVIAYIQEWGVRGYRWRVVPIDSAMREWDTQSITSGIRGLAATLAKMTPKLSQESTTLWDGIERRRSDRRQHALDTRVTPERRGT